MNLMEAWSKQFSAEGLSGNFGGGVEKARGCIECRECVEKCPQDVPVSTIMRYAYYYQGQGQEKFAMSKYAALEGRGASPCLDCQGQCAGACRYGLDIQTNMLQVHDLLTLA